jgi:predicted acylesterase/phospholipase RssA
LHSENLSKTIGLCFSGGGHRASIFSLGALLYLVDAGRHHDVKVISSVSGGSLTSGFFAVQEKSLNEMNLQNREEFDACAAKWARQIAGSPAWWWIVAAVHSALLLGAIVLTLRPDLLTKLIPLHLPWWGIPTTYLVAVCLWARAAGRLPGGTFWGWWGTWLYVAIAVPMALLLLFVVWQSPVYLVYFATVLVCIRISHFLPSSNFWNSCRILGLVALIAAVPVIVMRWDRLSWMWHMPAIVLGAWALAQRSRIADLAFRDTVCQDRLLRGIHAAPRHVFCATEMQTGRDAYFSRDFIYSRDAGLGEPADLHLSSALQASANFPVAFPFRTLGVDDHQFKLVESLKLLAESRLLALSDGGVFDNTGVAWFLGSTERRAGLKRSLDLSIATDAKYDSPSKPIRERVEAQLASLEDDPELLIVVNSSFPRAWSSAALRGIPVLGEIAALLRLEGALYDNRGREQCRDLHRQFWLQSRKGALVSIEQNPERLPVALRNLEQRRHSLQACLRDHEADARLWLNDQLRELGVSDIPDSLLEHYCQLAEAVRDRAVFGPEYASVLATAAKDYSELDERLRELRDQKARAPSLSLEEAKLEMVISECESEQWEIFRMLEDKRTKWDSDPARREEVNRSQEKTERCWNFPTTFRPLGVKATSELLKHGYLNCMNICYLLLEGFPYFDDPPTMEEFDRLAHGIVRKRHPPLNAPLTSAQSA